jgi:hypothetical protein
VRAISYDHPYDIFEDSKQNLTSLTEVRLFNFSLLFEVLRIPEFQGLLLCDRGISCISGIEVRLFTWQDHPSFQILILDSIEDVF